MSEKLLELFQGNKVIVNTCKKDLYLVILMNP